MAGLLIAGIPSSGKSTFGDWLEANRRFVHFDVEIENGRDLDEARIHRESDEALVDDRAASSFVHILEERYGRVVITWGFRPVLIDYVSRLMRAGMAGWWFGGDWAAARELHSRGKSLEAFDL